MQSCSPHLSTKTSVRHIHMESMISFRLKTSHQAMSKSHKYQSMETLWWNRKGRWLYWMKETLCRQALSETLFTTKEKKHAALQANIDAMIASLTLLTVSGLDRAQHNKLSSTSMNRLCRPKSLRKLQLSQQKQVWVKLLKCP